MRLWCCFPALREVALAAILVGFSGGNERGSLNRACASRRGGFPSIFDNDKIQANKYQNVNGRPTVDEESETSS
ncbi:hypothetical protein QBC41DRAFT_326607, partial [Cercophora samala]